MKNISIFYFIFDNQNAGVKLSFHNNLFNWILNVCLLFTWPIDDISDVPHFFRKKDELLFFPTVISAGNVFSTVITSGNLFRQL